MLMKTTNVMPTVATHYVIKLCCKFVIVNVTKKQFDFRSCSAGVMKSTFSPIGPPIHFKVDIICMPIV